MTSGPPTRSLPPFTTTIEPSSRWPTPWPVSLPGRVSATRTKSPTTIAGDSPCASLPRFQAAPRAPPARFVGGVGEALELIEHEACDHQIAADHAGARECDQLAVHQH